MAHSFYSVYLHLIFAWKERRPFVQQQWKDDFYQYICGIIKSKGAILKAIGGTSDHIHILCSLPGTVSYAELVKEIKSRSSAWIKNNHEPLFSWQEGYSAFSVGVPQLERVSSYINNQEEHHSSKSFEDEFRELLIAAGLSLPEQTRY